MGADGGAVEEPYRKSSRWTCETWLFYTLAFWGVRHSTYCLFRHTTGLEGLYILGLDIGSRAFFGFWHAFGGLHMAF